MNTKGKESNTKLSYNVFHLTSKLVLSGLLAFSICFHARSSVQESMSVLNSASFYSPAPILLTVTPAGTSLGGSYSLAILDWNVIDINKSGRYFVEQSNGGPWKTIGNLQYTAPGAANLNYTDTISSPYCTASVLNYRIRFEDGSSPSVYSNASPSYSFQDMTDPENVRNNVVSITPGGYPILTWQKARDKDVEKYRIYKFNGIIYQQVDSVNAQTTSYIDMKGKNACDSSYAYAIVSVDSCGHPSYGNYPAVADHRRGSIVLSFSGMDPCDRSAKLSWNPYYTMPGGLGGYNIYFEDNLVVTLIKTTDSATTSYTHVYPFIDSHAYKYYIEAFSKDGTLKSVSCQKGDTYTGSVIPDSLSILNATVVNNSFVLIHYHYEPENTAQVIILEQSETTDGPYIQVDSISAFGAGYLPVNGEFEDHTAMVNVQSYYYRLAIKDRNCQTKIPYLRAVARTILLTCSTMGQNNTLNWNDYEGWPSGVEKYVVYKLLHALPSPVASVFQPGPDNYTDISVSPDIPNMYWVEAVMKGNDTIKSVSNSCLCTRMIPNAFTPNGDGLNDIFRPLITSAEPQSYMLNIFNKWGQQIFETLEPDKGWDGQIHGTNAPVDVYAYRIKYTTLSGQDIILYGTVALIR